MISALLITGSRHATEDPHGATIERAMLDAANGGRPTLIHGKAPGADTIANRVARELRWPVRGVRADWMAPCRPECSHGGRRRNQNGRDYCPAAGNYRNQQLVDIAVEYLPDVVCLAFPTQTSIGTWDCVRRAKAAGIAVVVHELAVSGGRRAS